MPQGIEVALSGLVPDLEEKWCLQQSCLPIRVPKELLLTVTFALEL